MRKTFDLKRIYCHGEMANVDFLSSLFDVNEFQCALSKKVSHGFREGNLNVLHELDRLGHTPGQIQ